MIGMVFMYVYVYVVARRWICCLDEPSFFSLLLFGHGLGSSEIGPLFWNLRMVDRAMALAASRRGSGFNSCSRG